MNSKRKENHKPVQNEFTEKTLALSINKVCTYWMLKINFNDMIGLYAVFKKVGFKYIEKKITFPATSDTGKNLYETVMFCFNKLR